MDKFRRDRAEERRETALSVFLGCNLISDGGIISGQRLSLDNGNFCPRRTIYRSKA